MAVSPEVIAFYLALTGAVLALGILPYINRPRESTKVFLFFCLGSVGWMATLYLGFLFGTSETAHLSTLLFRWTFAFAIFQSGLLPVFFYYFPRKTFSLHPVVEKLYLLGLVFLSAFAALTPHVYTSVIITPGSATIGDVLGSHYPLFALMSLVYLFGAITMAVRKVKKTTGIDRSKAQIAGWGLGLFAFFSLLTNMILPMFEIIVFQLQAPLFCLFYIIPAVYALVRYRFLDFALLAQSALSFTSIVAVFVLPVILSMYILPFDKQVAVTVIMIVSAILFLKEMRDGVNTVWNYIIFGSETNRLQEIERSLEDFKISSQRGLASVIQALNVQDGRLLFAGEGDMGHLTTFFVEHPKLDLVQSELSYALNSKSVSPGLRRVEQEMDKYMVSLALPILDDAQNLLGIFLLENRVDGRRFSSQEVKVLKKVLNDAVVYITKESKYKKLITSRQPVEFMNALFHEIQQPLLVARTTQDLLDWKKQKPEDKQHLERTEQALGDLTHKLDRIGEAFQWQSGSMPLKRSYLDLETFLLRLESAFPEKNISHHIKTESLKGPLFFMDAHFLQVAFEEIIKNSFFFNKSETPQVVITVTKNRTDIVFQIKDNGIGIAEKHWAEVFDLLFVISKSRNHQECGLGVGLATARGIIMTHRGRIHVKKSSHKGTVIEVLLPLKYLDRS